MQTIRALIEGWLKGRYGYEGNQAYWAIAGLLLVVAVAVAVFRNTGPVLAGVTLGVGLLVLRVPRLALPLLLGSILLLGWIFFGPPQQPAL